MEYLQLKDGTRWRVAGGVSVDTEVESFRVESMRRPDTTWTHTDSNGHAHKYYRDEEKVPRLPTLERRERLAPCDGCSDIHGDCDGYTVEEWFCRQCGEQIEPGFTVAHDVEIPHSAISHYSVTVEDATNVPEGGIEGAVYVTVEPGGTQHHHPLPVLHAGNSTVTWGFGERVAQTELRGSEYQAITREPVGP